MWWDNISDAQRYIIVILRIFSNVQGYQAVMWRVFGNVEG